jgi:hypothetical protein
MWSNFALACYEVLEQSGALVPGQQSYTIGPGGNFNVTRPLRILQSPGTAYVQDTNGNNYPMRVVERDTWNMYSNRSNIITSNFPNVLFYDPQFPLGVINVLPYPNIAYMMFWDSLLQLTQFTSNVTVLSLPPGYEMAMVSNLAVLLYPFFFDPPIVQAKPEVVALAQSSLAAIKRTNARDNAALFEDAIVSRSQLSYNIYTDSVGSVVPGV